MRTQRNFHRVRCRKVARTSGSRAIPKLDPVEDMLHDAWFLIERFFDQKSIVPDMGRSLLGLAVVVRRRAVVRPARVCLTELLLDMD